MKPHQHYMTWALWALCLLVLFYGLGKAQLFEPDEGRNAEIAREILLTGDWVTPHNNFLPALDKPIPFFWLVAFAYKLFGISEGPARLPSALAALGCLVLVYRFCRRSFGVFEALWSMLVLATSIEFFVLARIVIFDMTLTFCTSLALFSFYAATQSEDERSRKRSCFLMYAAMAGGALIKGPIGILVPMMVIGGYLLVSKKLASVSRLHPFAGSIIVFAIVAPWYGWVEWRNPGYLKYFLAEENFQRLITSRFHRSEPWYYFVPVLVAGFVPWSLVLPAVVQDVWKERFDDRNLFLIAWVTLPFIFFSCSGSKLPHYILPIFPPLAILTGRCLQRKCSAPSAKTKWLLTLPWLVEFLSLAYFVLGTVWPGLLPEAIRPVVFERKTALWSFVFGVLAMLALALSIGRRDVEDQAEGGALRFFFISMMLAPLVTVHIMAGVSRFRSAKDIAEKSLRLQPAADRIVLYDTYLAGLLFYLKATEPIWLVSSGTKSNIMGSWYIAENQPPSAKGKVLYTFKELDEAWRASKQRFLIYVKGKNVSHLMDSQKSTPDQLSRMNVYILPMNR